MLFRKGSPNFSISQIKCYHEDEGSYETSIINAPSHIGTHIDIINKNNKIDLHRFMGRGILIDIPEYNTKTITLEQIKNKSSVKQDDFVFFRSSWSNYLGCEKYFEHPELSFEVIEWLSNMKINMIR